MRICVRKSTNGRSVAAKPAAGTDGLTADRATIRLERAKGIEPSYAAWEAAVLPLNYARAAFTLARRALRFNAGGIGSRRAVAGCGRGKNPLLKIEESARKIERVFDEFGEQRLRGRQFDPDLARHFVRFAF